GVNVSTFGTSRRMFRHTGTVERRIALLIQILRQHIIMQILVVGYHLDRQSREEDFHLDARLLQFH
ncbi:hypothetical protein PFISCL1PPCAC_14202, partial [Pristionchus fissidentatus]